jgi:TonB family protein
MNEASEIERFQSLDLKAVPWTRWLWSFAIHAGALLILIAIPVTVQRVVQPPDRVVAVSLVAPPPPPPPSPPARPVKPLPVTKVKPRVRFEAPPVKKLAVNTIVPPLPPADIPKPVETVHIEAPKVDLPTRPVVKEEVFPAKTVTPVSQDASRQVKTGGFGDPNGVPAASSPTHGLTLQRLGSFDASAGQSYGSGGAGKGASGSGKAIARAGFGDYDGSGGGSGGGASGSGKAVARAGFGDYDAPVSAAPAVKAAAPVETPVEITFKPKPAYTADAREKKVEGEVQLDVLFSSTGQIHVLRVVHGLGFGLDDSARAAAGGIRFHPATRNGSPVDVTGIVHIVFELT